VEEEEATVEDERGQQEDGSDDEDGLPYVRSKDPLPRRITDNRSVD
jgi:hypothetical protein